MKPLEEFIIREISEIKYLRIVLKFTVWQICKVTGYKRYFVESVCTRKKYKDFEIPVEYRAVFDQRYGKA